MCYLSPLLITFQTGGSCCKVAQWCCAQMAVYAVKCPAEVWRMRYTISDGVTMWLCRFVLLCDCILSASDTADTQRHFADDFLSPLLTLHGDRVPNVRITLARMLSKHSVVFGKLRVVCTYGVRVWKFCNLKLKFSRPWKVWKMIRGIEKSEKIFENYEAEP